MKMDVSMQLKSEYLQGAFLVNSVHTRLNVKKKNHIESIISLKFITLLVFESVNAL